MHRYWSEKLDPLKMGAAMVDRGLLGDRKGFKVYVIHSHLHGDHLYGLQAFKPIFLPSTEIHFISATHDDMTSVQTLEKMVFASPVFPVPWKFLASKRTHQMVHPGEWFEIPCSVGGNIKVFCLPMNHPNQAYGFRFVWGGKTIAITLDHEQGHEFDRHILELWEGANIVVTEAQYSCHQYKSCKGYGHISADAVGEHARDAKPDRVITTHHDPGSDFGTVRDIARTIEKISGVRTEFACQGTWF
jgi:ribonuclease BN (tRNA processing enzyme)